MARLTLPPLTKVMVVLLVVLSSVVTLLRYYQYSVVVKAMNDHDRMLLDASSSEEITDGRNFPPDQKTLDELPHPQDLYVPLLTIVPGKSMVYYPWILITSSFVEQNVLSFILTIAILLYGGRYCEHVWGSVELSRFMLIQTVVPNCIALLFYLFIYSIKDPQSSKAIITICGGTSIISGFLVAFKQLVPEHTIVLFKGRIKFRVKQLPILFLGMSTFLGIIGSDLYAIMAWTGFFTSWIYLRFFRVTYTDPLLPFNSNSTAASVVSSYEHSNPSGIRIKGDASGSFALSGFFPPPATEYVDKMANSMFSLLLALHICSPFTAAEIEAANMRTAARVSQFGLQTAQPPATKPPQQNRYPRGSARAEAERRRALALKALEQRVQPSSASPEPSTNRPNQNIQPPGPAVLPRPHVGK